MSWRHLQRATDLAAPRAPRTYSEDGRDHLGDTATRPGQEQEVELADGAGNRASVASPGWGHLAESGASARSEGEVVVEERPQDTKRRSGRGRRWVRRVIVAALTLALMLFIPAFIVRMYTVPSESMETTLHGCAGCDNDRVGVDRIVHRFRAPHPGGVVVFTPGPDVWSNSEEQHPGGSNPLVRGLRSLGSMVGIATPSGPDFVKRVIAVGGQTVSCCDTRDRIIVDGVAVDEPYVYFSLAAGPAQQTPFPEVKVPAGMMWMMGDNRNTSLDSRAPGNGQVPVSTLDGKVRMIIYSLGRLGAVEDTNPQQPRQYGAARRLPRALKPHPLTHDEGPRTLDSGAGA